ncbi:mannose-1-phosphate guanylyltransferase (GDP) [Pseudopedobacter saltans DSM 12145]|uniref:mannose-1-phosphate guanylyltransferase n=1 Tax=Pseudopedobacter saltans (strain ATCC 51119 / DSM 12145 / JCM 21818 / CCUG 39354 / LMG 10337 / NBRC 100064 / NCIMB 13643) TaxID=762903 RepID=F0SAZ8_PSESL|nr:mannose-1-phosphate guanylyltransferase (GDP) [Pseudopedobacter saltans DSM 12145]
MDNNFALIMAGGVGSRFWPVSRTSFPKQFLDILGTGQSLIQTTFARFKKIVPVENIYILTNEIYRSLVQEHLPELSAHQIICEPVMRNTAPCIAYGTAKIRKINPKANIVVAPSDHLILDTENFVETINKALKASEIHDCLITLGIKPSRPDTGYGYIQYADDELLCEDLHKVKTFTEKPSLEIAETFLASGDFLWNSGIFVWSADSINTAFDKFLPDMNEIFKEGEKHYNTETEVEYIQAGFQKCVNISIDYGIMEKADNVYVMPADFGWSDLGTWASVYDLSEKDYVGNAVTNKERVIMYDSSNCMVNVPKGKMVILEGLHDYIVVESNDTLLICPRKNEQHVKQIVVDVKQKFGQEYI